MRSLSIQASLRAWFFVLTALLLLVFSSVLYFGLRRSLLRSLDSELISAGGSMWGQVEWEEGEPKLEGQELSERRNLRLGKGWGFELRDAKTQKVLLRGGQALPPFRAPGSLASRISRFETLPGTPRRRLYEHLGVFGAEGGGEGKEERGEQEAPPLSLILRLSRSLAPIEAQLGEVRFTILVLSAFSLLVLLGFSQFLSRRFIRPLRELSQAARGLKAQEEGSLPRSHNGDELDQLAAILGDSFGALYGALARQRRFTSDASHELRNPVASIQNAAEVALRQDRSPDEYKEFLRDILGSSQRMGKLISALLLLARMDRGMAVQKEEVDLPVFLREIVQELGPGAQRVKVSAPTHLLVRIQPDLFRILVENLLKNSLHYTSADQPIEVHLKAEPRNCLVIRDHGEGVPPALQPKLFDRFVRGDQANPNREGAGLGLSLVAEIARVHPLGLRVDFLEDGTLFEIEFGK